MATQTPIEPAAASPVAPSNSYSYARAVAGRRSKWVVLAVWLLLITVGGSLASKIGTVQNNDPVSWLPTNSESTRAVQLGEQHFADQHISNAVVVYARAGGLSQDDLTKVDADRSTLTNQRVAAKDISTVTVSQDKAAAYYTIPLRSAPNDNSVLGDGVDRVRSTVRASAPGGLDVRVTGEAGTIGDYNHVYSGLNGLLLGIAILLVAAILLFTYRSPVLWLLPLLSVILASEVASGVVYLLGKHASLQVDGYSSYVLTVLSLGVGTDYALLLIARYREELHRHEDRHEAMAYALSRSLPAIAASAGTVTIAMLCLLFGTMHSTRGLGPVVAIGVTVVFLAITSLLPALLVIMGRWVFWPFVPRYSADYDTGADTGRRRWAAVARTVGRRSRPLWIGTVVVLGALALGSFSIATGQTQAEQFTKTVDSVAGQGLLAQHFAAGSAAPADVYVPDAGAAAALSTLNQVPGVSKATTVGSAGGYTRLAAVLDTGADTPAARQTIDRIRAALHSSTGGAQSAVVGGPSAVTLDTARAEKKETKLLIPLVLAVVLVMLVLLLRALVAPVVLLLSVVLSYAAAVGTAGLLFHALGHPRIDPGLPLFGFVFLVALGVDYTIFLMTRAREEVQRRGHREGILTSLSVTGGVITSAGLVLAATFLVLTVVPTVGSLQQGLLVAVGLLLDTFLVRSLLVPALALDIGPATWWPNRLAASEPATG